MKKKILYIVNPISGVHQKEKVIEKADALTNRDIYEVEIVQTEYAGHAALLAAEAAEKGFDVVVAVGGDGTVNEVGRAIVHSDTALGIVPCGSGNGLARHLRIPMNVESAIDIINEGVVHKLDYCTVNDKPFFCTCGVGFDAFISEKFANAGKRGLLTYIENTLRSGLNYKPQTYIIEDENGAETCRAFLIACANASQYGNDAYIAPDASMRDGLFDVVVMEPFLPIEAPQVAIQLFNGTLPDNSHVKTFKASHLRIRREGEGVAHYDGDPFITGDVIDINLHHCEFNAIINPRKREIMAAQTPVKNLLQLVPEFFSEWKRTPETLLNKTGHDLRKFNKNIIDKIKGLTE